MKKNKKYWKEQAKDWKEVASIESGQANYWSNRALKAQEERDKFKNELDVLRQYNIGKPMTMEAGRTYGIPFPPVTTKIHSIDNANIPSSGLTSSTQSKNISVNPFSKKCKCNCDCNK